MEVARSKVENSPGISGSDDNPGPFDKLYKIKTDLDSAFFLIRQQSNLFTMTIL